MNQEIKCNTFQDSRAIIEKTKVKVKEAGNAKEKQYYAQDILLEAEGLLSCSNYNTKNSDCLNCHSISRIYVQEYKHLAKDETKENIINKPH